MAKKDERKMRVLMSAYACEPGKGSEPGVGWNMAKVMAKKVELSVVTRANNRHVIEASKEDWVSHVNWIYFDPPRWMMWWKKGGRGVQPFYILWQVGVYLKLAWAGEGKKHDVVNHVTFGKYWVPSVLPLLGLPTIFGSVGGGEYTPHELRKVVSHVTLRAERTKRIIVWLLTYNPISWLLFKKISLAYAATEQTKNALEKLGVSNVQLLPQSGISSNDLDHYASLSKDVSLTEPRADFVACSAARLISWKGVDISIRAFITALPNLPSHSILLVTGVGPELARLESIVKEAGVGDRVLFLGQLPLMDDVYRMMAGADCLLHAATSEAFGQACAESLGLGTPVVCWDWAGPGIIVNSDCGVSVNPASEDPIGSFARAIENLGNRNSEEKNKSREMCVKRIRDEFLWGNIGNKVFQGYCSVYAGPME